ncbi:hypothetical protein COJ71_07945 [Bacillus cereus]|nr:hypothetical protein COJ71_07945 [Bacillus cereus]
MGFVIKYIRPTTLESKCSKRLYPQYKENDAYLELALYIDKLALQLLKEYKLIKKFIKMLIFMQSLL